MNKKSFLVLQTPLKMQLLPIFLMQKKVKHYFLSQNTTGKLCLNLGYIVKDSKNTWESLPELYL